MTNTKNPFQKGHNPYNLGELAMKIIDKKYKSKWSKIIVSFKDIKRMMEMDIAKKGSADSFGFTVDDLNALFGEAVKGLEGAKWKAMISDIASKQYDKLSYKQKDMLDKISVPLYDIIVQSSGGHKDITNVSGLNFIGKGYVNTLKQIMIDLADELKDAQLE